MYKLDSGIPRISKKITVYTLVLFKEKNQCLNTFLFSNAVFYAKGYNSVMNHSTMCEACFSALVKNKIPTFSVANRMWTGYVPDALQQLTIAEEKL